MSSTWPNLTQPNPTCPTQPNLTQPTHLTLPYLPGRGECFLPCKSPKNRGHPTPNHAGSYVSCFIVVLACVIFTVFLRSNFIFGRFFDVLLRSETQGICDMLLLTCILPAKKKTGVFFECFFAGIRVC